MSPTVLQFFRIYHSGLIGQYQISWFRENTAHRTNVCQFFNKVFLQNSIMYQSSIIVSHLNVWLTTHAIAKIVETLWCCLSNDQQSSKADSCCSGKQMIQSVKPHTKRGDMWLYPSVYMTEIIYCVYLPAILTLHNIIVALSRLFGEVTLF